MNDFFKKKLERYFQKTLKKWQIHSLKWFKEILGSFLQTQDLTLSYSKCKSEPWWKNTKKVVREAFFKHKSRL